MNNTRNKYEYMRWGRYVVLIVLLGLGLNHNGCVRVAEASHKRIRVFESIRALAPVSNILLPAFHFRPPQHWINDPNGPMYYNGVYHFFYQYNPQGSVWGNIVWAHSVSTDLINWQSLDPALYPSKPFDIDGCWSGSATILPRTGPAILYTGVDPHSNQVQNIALPANLSDPYLRVWVKPDYNPLVVPSPSMNASCFRDPTTAWYDRGHWKMLVGGRQHRSGVAYLYRSKDFKRWIKAKHPLHAGQNSGMWECPDFYPVSVSHTGLDTTVVRPTSNSKKAGDKYVLKVSLDRTRYDYYTVGRYDKSVDKYFPDNPSLDNLNGLRYDYGNFYASKTFYDPKKKRRILWGWANESDAKPMDVHKGWAGIQAIPRKVWLDPSRKQLLQWPIEELETLRRNPVHLKNQNVQKGHLLEVKGVTAAQADVEVVFRLPSRLDTAEKFDPKWVNPEELCGHKGSTVEGGIGPFGLATLASAGLEEYTPVFFRVFKAHNNNNNNNHVVLMCSDASTSSTITSKEMYKPSFAGFVDVDLKDRKLSLRSLIDHSVVESFGAHGKTCITSRVYPTKAVFERAHLYVFNNGTSPVTVDTLDAWSMAKPAKMNQPLA